MVNAVHQIGFWLMIFCSLVLNTAASVSGDIRFEVISGSEMAATSNGSRITGALQSSIIVQDDGSQNNIVLGTQGTEVQHQGPITIIYP